MKWTRAKKGKKPSATGSANVEGFFEDIGLGEESAREASYLEATF